MRLAVLFALALAACYRPNIPGESFYCHPLDNPACPDGETCFNGRCVSFIGFDGGGGGGDMSLPPMPDQGMGARDMKGSSCMPTGGDCTYHNNKACCSNYCEYATNTCR